MRLDALGIAGSTGSACSSKSLAPSHVLLAMGLTHLQAHGSLRLTLSRFTTREETDYAAEKLLGVVEGLRKISPLKKVK
jgi:cysteine desulfurase